MIYIWSEISVHKDMKHCKPTLTNSVTSSDSEIYRYKTKRIVLYGCGIDTLLPNNNKIACSSVVPVTLWSRDFMMCLCLKERQKWNSEAMSQLTLYYTELHNDPRIQCITESLNLYFARLEAEECEVECSCREVKQHLMYFRILSQIVHPIAEQCNN